MNKGKIVQIIGPVVDLEFAGKVPALYNALTVEYDLPNAIWAVVISKSSFVMFAWRSLLYSSVRSLMICLALSVAFFIATMRALCSLEYNKLRQANITKELLEITTAQMAIG